MIKWIEKFRNEVLTHPELVELIPSSSLNPEDSYYYQQFIYHQVDPEYDRPHADVCPPKDSETMKKEIDQYTPQNDAGKELYEVLKEEMSFEKMIAVEVDHCT